MKNITYTEIPIYWNKIIKLDFTSKKKRLTKKILSKYWITEDTLKEYNTSINQLIENAYNYKKYLEENFKRKSIEYEKNVQKFIDTQECTDENDYNKKFFWGKPEKNIYSQTEIILNSKWKILIIILWSKYLNLN
jgi:hypothetical protein